MNRRTPKRPHGSIRRSQLITTFGPGSIVDLPRHSVIMGGLEHWRGEGTPIQEERLAAKVRAYLGLPQVGLVSPPVATGDPREGGVGVTGFQFPEWFTAAYEETRGRFRSRPLVNSQGLVDHHSKFVGPDRKKYPVVPVRFVQGCLNGHISDLDWYGFVHEYKSQCRRALWVEERGPSGDLADLFVRCDCGASRSVAAALRLGKDALGFCRGARPWLGPMASELCRGDSGTALPNRLLIRTASDAYFPQILRVISIPEADATLKAAVGAVWDDFLQYVETEDDLRRERRKAKVTAAIGDFSDERVLAEIRRRKTGVQVQTRKIKEVEIETLLAVGESWGEDVPEGADFYAMRLPLTEDERNLMPGLERLVLVHRLREVMALVGFTRFEPSVPDIDGELALDVRRADIAQELTWAPAVENRGEGLFLALDAGAMQAWLARQEVQERGRELLRGFEALQERDKAPLGDFPGLPYVLLHSLSHLLITAMSLECGYAASAIRERIYAGPSGYGLLLYTGTPDSEGTLGGLVEVGRHLARHFRHALELGRLCSNDPVCSQHRPDKHHEERQLQGAACHGCLLIAEPSCERRNEFLDRALVVETVDRMGAAFFSEAD